MSYEVVDFQKDVIEASRATPVVVDFWAPWCGPCRILGPVLEKLAQEAAGRWRLVKVNTDVHSSEAARYGIRGIPAVKLFVDGQVVDEFVGALPEYAVRQWLEKAIPTESRKLVEQAEHEIAADNREEARRLLETVLEAEPGNPKARVLLAQLLAFEDPDRSLELVSDATFAGAGYVQIGEAVKTIARLLNLNGQLPEGSGRESYQAAIVALKEGRYEDAMQSFIEVIQTDRYYDDDGARKACIALFTLLGNGHPAVSKYRRSFDMALY